MTEDYKTKFPIDSKWKTRGGEALKAENEELRAKLDLVPQWQPIETLPQKDFMFTGYSKAYGAIPIRLTAAVDSDGNDLGLKFFCGITWGDAICVSDITHWMPIPKPPTEKNDE